MNRYIKLPARRIAILITLFILPTFLMSQQINVISFNIRYNTPNDGENAWPNRISMVTSLLKFHEADIFGMQEALSGQIEDIEKDLPGYEWFGKGRKDGKKGGEFCPVFFNKSKFILLDNGIFWLSETPDKPSRGWDAALNRVVTWGKFQSKITGKQFLFFNTHFDHVGIEARKNSADLIWSKINEMTAGKDLPVILTGDFNLKPEQKPIKKLKQHLYDSRDVTAQPPYGPLGTFNNFEIDNELKKRIDYIFISAGVKVLKYAVLTDFCDHRFPSDHLPVFATLVLK
ncbi:MAG: endonuclease [Draconibacterium sp.]|nr:MAG: endonuclease [Draconibacterium sp.]